MDSINGSQGQREMNTEINSICRALVVLINDNDQLFKGMPLGEAQVLSAKMITAVEEAEQKIMERTIAIGTPKDYGDRNYLVDWLKTHYEEISRAITKETFEVLEVEKKDDFEFEQSLVTTMRYLFKAYLNQEKEWLKEAGFLFDFELFERKKKEK